MKWTEWRGSFDGRPAMYIKRLFELNGWRLDLHKFVRPDDDGCFHTHPAKAWRFIVWGGYSEQLSDGTVVRRGVGFFGGVNPELEHRIHSLNNGMTSWSLWLRAPKTHKIYLRGC